MARHGQQTKDALFLLHEARTKMIQAGAILWESGHWGAANDCYDVDNSRSLVRQLDRITVRVNQENDDL